MAHWPSRRGDPAGLSLLAVSLQFRLARTEELPALEKMVIDAFEPITWMKKFDAAFGPLNGTDWRARWRGRMAKIFETQILLVGETGGEPVAFASGLVDPLTAMGFVDVLAVSRAHHGRGYGREMLRGIMQHFRELGCRYVHLDCLTDNDVANSLYESEGFFEVARQIRWFREL
jgi:GNAT superfamily N-acetyltransferase